MTKFGHLSCTQYCCKPLCREWKKNNISAHKVNHSSREIISSLSCLDLIQMFSYVIAIDSSNVYKWSRATDITNMAGQTNFYFLQRSENTNEPQKTLNVYQTLLPLWGGVWGRDYSSI